MRIDRDAATVSVIIICGLSRALSEFCEVRIFESCAFL